MLTATVTTNGRITLPLEIRKRHGLTAGAKVDFAIEGDHFVVRVLPSETNEAAVAAADRAAAPTG